MPSVKISQLPEVSATSGTERFLVIQGGVSKQVLLNKLFNGLTSNQSFNFNVQTNDFNITNNAINLVTVKGNTTNNVGIFNNNPLSKLHVGGSCQIGTSATISSMVTTPAVVPAIYISPYGLVRNSSEIPLDTDTTLISISTSTAYNLNDGINGQTKTVILYDISNGATASISTSHSLGFSYINLSVVGSSVVLKFVFVSFMMTLLLHKDSKYFGLQI